MPIKTKFPISKGFTLIELLVSISVVSLLSSLGLAAFSQFNRRQILVTATRAFFTNLRFAQSKADNNEKPAGCTGDLIGYRLYFIDSSTYALAAHCASSSVEINRITLTPPVVKGSGFTNVEFRTLRNSVIDGGNVTLTAFGLTRTITVNPGGEIKLLQ